MDRVSVIIPAYNEEKTIGQVVEKVKQSSVVNEIIVVNNCSTDNTAEIAKQKGGTVVVCNLRGKGYAMEEGMKHITGDIVAFIDGDLGIYNNDVVATMTEPIINKDIDFTKSAFEREGGRVTELVAKPLLELLFPEQSKFKQPLSGIIAGRTECFKKITFEKDYGVDIGILLDMIKIGANVEEIYIGRIDNNSQSWQSLPKMAKEVASAILKRANMIK